MNIFKVFKRNTPVKEELICNISSENKLDISTDNTQAPIENLESECLNDVLPNGNTISEQQLLDYEILIGNYPDDIPSFLNMRIVSNTIPPQDGYDFLTKDEKTFFSAFQAKLHETKYNPASIKLTRLSDGTFNVEHIDLCYIGKIRFYQESVTYAVVKKGNKRATKIFSQFSEAQDFSTTNEAYEIQKRTNQSESYMQYLIGSTSIKELDNPSLQQCIDTIPRWIKYLNYCKRN